MTCDIIGRSRKIRHAGMAQSVEHVIGNDEVISSILIASSIHIGARSCANVKDDFPLLAWLSR